MLKRCLSLSTSIVAASFDIPVDVGDVVDVAFFLYRLSDKSGGRKKGFKRINEETDIKNDSFNIYI